GIQANGSNQVIVGNNLTGNSAIDLRCQESAGCIGNVVNSNAVTNATKQNRGIYFDASSYSFTGINVIGDTVTNVTYGLEFQNTSSTGRIQVLFGGTVSHPYYAVPSATNDVPSGFIAEETGTAAPTTTCSNGSTFTNTSGAAGTTFYGCEAGAWVAK
ncbi:MAG: hypothetical protein P8Z30_18600, partial [Acidobacteriota bacterium]